MAGCMIMMYFINRQLGRKLGKAAIAPLQSEKEKEMEEAFIIE